MSEMVERVARAIDPGAWAFIDGCGPRAWSAEYGYPDDARVASLNRARAAIEAMREPTFLMCIEPGDGENHCRRIWQSMIQAALTPSEREG